MARGKSKKAERRVVGGVVGVGSLRVMIVKDGLDWIAQGLEIDYAAAGPSVAKVKHNFERGLALTVYEHIKRYGNVGKFAPAPPEVWQEFVFSQGVKRYVFSQTTLHLEEREAQGALPFDGITYMQAAEASVG